MIETKRLLLIPVDFEMIDSLIESNKAFFNRYGYMSEALLAMLDMGKENGIVRVIADTSIDNIKSQNALARCGFSLIEKDDDKLWFSTNLFDH